MYEDNPMALVMEKWQRYFYGDTSYGRSTIGTQENIQSFTQEMLFDHKADLYSKDNLIIIIAGKFVDLEAMKAHLEKLFSPLPQKRRIEKPEFLHALPTEKVGFYEKKTEQNHLVISAMGFDGNDERKYAANVLATILGGNMSSRLFQNIREKEGLCYYIKAMHMSELEHGVFVVRAGIDKERFDF
jgi:predicted Zn-dependent peptidase